MPNIRTNYYEYTTAPEFTPGIVVTLDLVKQNANIDFDSSDELLQFYIDTAIERIEKATGRLLRPAVSNGFYPYPAYSKYYTTGYVPIERAPITAVNEVATWDEALGDYQALTLSTDYEIEQKFAHWRIVFEGNVIFNENLDFDDIKPYLIRVGFDHGYATSDDIPFPLRTAVMQYATMLFENRGDCSECACTNTAGGLIPSTIFDLISPYIIRRAFG
jgi:uncharacterized phiE125 gp8 family phage protein